MKKQIITSAILASVALAACGGGSDSEGAAADTTVASAATDAPEVAPPTTEAAVATTEAAPPTTEAAPPTTEPAAGGALNFETDGPAACINAVIEHLGPDAMVNEISSFFETGIEDSDYEVGQLYICTAMYQDPSDPIKLLNITMDTDTGEFSEPGPVDISVSGDPTEFDLNDYVMKASDINVSVIQPRMDEEAPALDEVYSVWGWNRVGLVAPGGFNDVHVFDIRMEGRLAANDIGADGYMTFDMDGNVVVDHLDP